mmetsp:Transcript_7210/g.15987  ORF Transcript_7210/g.15987 Transcript_7210/m.15987 type:complete len:85 (+) Transcript_7210:334-588(+)
MVTSTLQSMPHKVPAAMIRVLHTSRPLLPNQGEMPRVLKVPGSLQQCLKSRTNIGCSKSVCADRWHLLSHGLRQMPSLLHFLLI